jgi:hypothetical protein
VLYYRYGKLKIKENLKMKKVSAQNKADLKARKMWSLSPVERVKESKKVYNRQQWKKEVYA